MEIKNYDFSKPEELERMCKDAAEGCYFPSPDQRTFAMSVVIQNFALPRNEESFDANVLAKHIQRKLQVIMATRGVLDGGK